MKSANRVSYFHEEGIITRKFDNIMGVKNLQYSILYRYQTPIASSLNSIKCSHIRGQTSVLCQLSYLWRNIFKSALNKNVTFFQSALNIGHEFRP